MKGSRAAYRYAKSLLDLAVEQGKIEEVYADMTLIEKTVDESRELEVLLKSPVVKTDQKQAVLSKLFDGKLSKVSENFISILTNKRREVLLAGIAASYVSQYRVHKNILTAEITTAIPLDDALRGKVLEVVQKTDERMKEVTLVEKVDPEIIGGIIIRMGDNQLDASIARRINDLKQEFTKNPFIADF